eukprot:15439449-Alexandrium_andersonii.AAC.1
MHACQEAYDQLVPSVSLALKDHAIADDGQNLRAAVAECDKAHAALKSPLFAKDLSEMRRRLDSLDREKTFVHDAGEALQRGGPTANFAELKSGD